MTWLTFIMRHSRALMVFGLIAAIWLYGQWNYHKGYAEAKTAAALVAATQTVAGAKSRGRIDRATKTKTHIAIIDDSRKRDFLRPDTGP